MVNVPSLPEIITVNSETLQTQIRDLLPSQNGFGSELQATNVITPIIDLTAAAEGSGLATDLARAIAFGSQTAFDVSNTSTVIANAPGFYRFFGVYSYSSSNPSDQDAQISFTDGSTTKIIWRVDTPSTSANQQYSPVNIEFTFWLASGESCTVTTARNDNRIAGSVRQVADSTGQTVNPSGYPL